MAHHLNPGRMSRRVPLSSAVPTVWRNTTQSAVTVRLVGSVPFHVSRGRDGTAEAAVTDMLVPAMSAISVTLEPKEHLSFLAYSILPAGAKFRAKDGGYEVDAAPPAYVEGAVWVRLDGFVWASEVR